MTCWLRVEPSTVLMSSSGSKTAAFNINPRTALAIDIGVAMDFPRARPEDQGRLDPGKGPSPQGANTNPVVFELLRSVAKEENIPFQIQALGSSSPTDARVIQEIGGGASGGCRCHCAICTRRRKTSRLGEGHKRQGIPSDPNRRGVRPFVHERPQASPANQIFTPVSADMASHARLARELPE